MLAGSTYVPPIPGVTLGHHDLSHHGKDPGKLEQLKIVEVETMKTVRDLLAKLKQTKEDGANLLDRTTVFLGSNLGDGSSHSVKNLPVLLAGGGFRHGQHLPFDPSFVERPGSSAIPAGTRHDPLTRPTSPGVRSCQRPSVVRGPASVRTGQQKLYRYRVKYDIDSWTSQSLLNRYVRRDCRAFWPRAVAC